jgi:hypothetical protein
MLEVVRPLEAVRTFCPALQLNLYGMGGDDAFKLPSVFLLDTFHDIRCVMSDF